MDFEALQNLVKSGQDEIFLLVFNACLANIMLFKTEFSLDKDMFDIINRLNQGGNLLKGVNTIFQGSVCVLKEETANKNTKTPAKTNINLPTKSTFTMCKGNLEEFSLHSEETAQYNIDIDRLKTHIKEQVKPTFKNGTDFLSLLKIIMAKMARGDFTSLKGCDLETRITLFIENFQNVLRFGSVLDAESTHHGSPLKSYDENSSIINENVKLQVEGIPNIKLTLVYQDSEIVIGKNIDAIIEILNRHYQKTHDNHVTWKQVLANFIKKAVKIRNSRVMEWIDVNLHKWSERKEFT